MHNSKYNIETNYTMQDGNETFELGTVKTEKDLGDSNLSFRDHINSKVNLANINLGIIFRTLTYLARKLLFICKNHLCVLTSSTQHQIGRFTTKKTE